jgi:hypothetical protein
MRRKLRGLGFTDTPQRLVYAGDNATKRVRAAWLEQAALALSTSAYGAGVRTRWPSCGHRLGGSS